MTKEEMCKARGWDYKELDRILEEGRRFEDPLDNCGCTTFLPPSLGDIMTTAQEGETVEVWLFADKVVSEGEDNAELMEWQDPPT